MATRYARMRAPRRYAADKSTVGTTTLLPVQLASPRETLLADLRALASRMIGQGHRPASFLLLRLTDGRIKMVQSPGGPEQASDELQRITNEYGPAGAAFRVWTEQEGGELVACVDELHLPAISELQPHWPSCFAISHRLS